MSGPHSFRIRVLLPPDRDFKIETREAGLAFEVPGLPTQCTLKTRQGPDQTGSQLIIRCGGFPDADSAATAGQQMLAILGITPILTRVGIDVGKDAPRSGFTSIGLRRLEASSEAPIQALNDIHGLVVFPDNPLPRFASLGPMRAVVGAPAEWLMSAIQQLHQQPITPSPKQILGLDLFSAAQFEGSLRARFLLLVALVEVLAERSERDRVWVSMLAEFEKTVLEVGQGSKEAQSLVGGLQALREESIGAACRRLAETHGGDHGTIRR